MDCMGATTFSIMSLRIKGLFATLSISVLINITLSVAFLNVVLSVVMLSAIKLSVVKLNVIMLSVAAPIKCLFK